jgi:hypothetical protein
LPAPSERKFAIHADDAEPHIAQKCRRFGAENRICLTPRPPASPHLAPSDFFLFKHVSRRQQGINFQSHDELPAEIVAIVSQIPIETSQRIFDHWMEKPEWVSRTNGDYYS